MIKSKTCNALTQLINTNCIQLEAMGWVERVKEKDTEEQS
jgi:hypothetical protein